MEDVHNGVPYRAIGKKYQVSAQRVAQIVQVNQETVSDDGWRSLDFARLEHLGESLFGKFCGPDMPLVSARGIVYETMRDPDTGKIVQDFTRPVPDARLKIEQALAYAKIQERKAKLTGTDRLKARTVDQSKEQEEFLAYIQQLADDNDVLKKKVELLSRGVIEAEVIPDEEQTATI